MPEKISGAVARAYHDSVVERDAERIAKLEAALSASTCHGPDFVLATLDAKAKAEAERDAFDKWLRERTAQLTEAKAANKRLRDLLEEAERTICAHLRRLDEQEGEVKARYGSVLVRQIRDELKGGG